MDGVVYGNMPRVLLRDLAFRGSSGFETAGSSQVRRFAKDDSNELGLDPFLRFVCLLGYADEIN